MGRSRQAKIRKLGGVAKPPNRFPTERIYDDIITRADRRGRLDVADDEMWRSIVRGMGLALGINPNAIEETIRIFQLGKDSLVRL
jgi:hypothetical protein